MSKPFIALLFGGIFFCLGLLTAATMIEHDRQVARHIIDAAIVLELPKDEADLAHQLLYLGASKGMLEELQRQRMVKNETTHATPNPVRVQSKPHAKGK